MIKQALEYSPVIYDRILRCLRARHPSPCFSGQLSLESKYSLNVVANAIEVLKERGLIRAMTLDEKKIAGWKDVHDLYVLTDSGYKSMNSE